MPHCQSPTRHRKSTTKTAFGCRTLFVFQKGAGFPLDRYRRPDGLECSVQLQCLPKRFLRLVMLVPIPLVKRMRALANHIRPHRHSFAFFRPRPGFRRFQQTRTNPATPRRCADNEPINLSSQRHFEQIRNAHMNPTGHFAAIFGDKNRVQRRRLHAPESNLHLRRCRWITELARKLRQPRHITRPSAPNFQLRLREPRRPLRLCVIFSPSLHRRNSKSRAKTSCPNPAKSSPDLRSPTRPTSSSETRRSVHRLRASAAPHKIRRTTRSPAPAAPPR